jgi:porphobilinogen synthase
MAAETLDKQRPRRLRVSPCIRKLVSETLINPRQLVAPIFVRPGRGIVEPIKSMPGINRYSVDTVGEYVSELADVGIEAVLLFGIPAVKDEIGSSAYDREGVVPKAISAVRDSVSSTAIIADVCLCEYTSHGHCGIIKDGAVDNDGTLPLLGKAAVAYAEAGADIVAPSAMMDHQVRAIRGALDISGHEHTAIMGYSAKYASSFYGPFRDAAGSVPSFGDRKGYQIGPSNRREAMKEIALDIQEGADIIMVKPALAYLDVIAEARRRFNVPIAAYSVSGEYSMLKAAGSMGLVNENEAMLELLLSIKRAGADIIITYHAAEAARASISQR